MAAIWDQELHLSFNAEFKNKWGFQTNLIGHTQQLDTRILRGGYDMFLPGGFMSFGGINTDHSKRVSAGLEYDYRVQRQSIGEQLQYRTRNNSPAFQYLKNWDECELC